MMAWGYSGSPGGSGGMSELIGQVTPSVSGLRAYFRIGGRQYQARVLFSRVRRTLSGLLHTSASGIFSVDIPTCIEGSQLRFQLFEGAHRSFKVTPQFRQRAACETGDGFVFRGDLSFGELPPSLDLPKES